MILTRLSIKDFGHRSINLRQVTNMSKLNSINASSNPFQSIDRSQTLDIMCIFDPTDVAITLEAMSISDSRNTFTTSMFNDNKSKTMKTLSNLLNNTIFFVKLKYHLQKPQQTAVQPRP